MRLTRLQVLFASVLLVASMPTPARSATFQPTLSLNRSSGPVGSTVTLSGAQAQGQCGGIVFGPSPNIVGGKYLGGDGFSAGAGSPFRISYVIPPYLPGGLLPYVVVPGHYMFEIVCDESNNPATALSVTVPFTVTSNAVPPGRFVGMASTPDGAGYWLAQAGGGIFNFGNAGTEGSLPSLHISPAAPIVGIAASPTGLGYWLVGADGGVFSFGSAGFHGSLPALGIRPARPIVGITATPDGGGYWLLGVDGGVFAFGDAPFEGTPLSLGYASGLAVELVSTPDGQGYYLTGVGPLASPFGDAATGGAFASPGSRLAGFAATLNVMGFWFASTDGNVSTGFSGGAPTLDLPPNYGSLHSLGITPAAPIVGIVRTPDAQGYWLVGEDGGVFAFGDAGFHGSAA